MKKVLVSALLLSGLYATAKDKNDKPDPAFDKGDITVAAAYGSQTFYGLVPGAYYASSNVSVFGEYQLSRNFNLGLQYSYEYQDTKLVRANYKINGMIPVNGPTYQQEHWSRQHIFLIMAEYCYFNRGKISLSGGIGTGPIIDNREEHTIDSAGISTYKIRSSYLLGGQLQLVNAKVRLSENWGLYGGLGLGYRGILSLGAHYTFNKHKN